jgi:hypothetical protein
VVIHSFARRAVRETPVPNAVRLRQYGETCLDLRAHWRPLTAEQVISVYEPGFVWFARMQTAPPDLHASLTAM